MGFRIRALDAGQFKHLFGQDEEMLRTQGVLRKVADSCPGYPCRVSLQDAEVGESVLLMNFEHQPKPTPFRATHAIYIREGASEAHPAVNKVPEMFRHRLLSVRAFDADGMMIDADVVDGQQLESLIGRLFENGAVDELHLHNARLGCYAARVERA